MITNRGASAPGADGGFTQFNDSSQAGSSTVISNGGEVVGAAGGFVEFNGSSFADSATLIANNATGAAGGSIFFFNNSTGGTSRNEIFGNGKLDISGHTGSLVVGSIEGDGNIFLGGNRLAVGSNNLSTTFSAVIQDGGVNGGSGGGLDKIGPDTLTLTGSNTYSGGTIIDYGVLSVGNPNALGTGNVLISAFGGEATLRTAGEAPLTFFAGDSNHDFKMNGGTPPAILRMKVGGTVQMVDADFMHVGRDAFLSGVLFVHRINSYAPAPGDRVTILDTGDSTGRNGIFESVQSDFPDLIRPSADYFDNHVDVVFDLTNTFASQGVTPNQTAVGRALDRSRIDNCVPDLVRVTGNLLPADLPHAFDLIAPEELSSIYEIGFSQSVVHNENLMRRMDDIRAGSNGYCGPVVEVPRSSGKDYAPPIQDKNVAIPDKNVAPSAFVSCPENRWGVFATGTGDFVNVGDDDSNARGYDISTGSFTLGADYRVGDHFAIGLDGGYASSTADLIDRGRVDVDGGKIGGYATVFGNGFWKSKLHLDGAVGGGWNNYDTRRTGLSSSSSSGETVRGSTDGSEFDALVSYGADWNFGCFNVGTWSTIQYTNVSINSFTETGSLAPLEIRDQDQDSIRGTSGIRMSYDIKKGCRIIRPEVRAAWLHEYGDNSYAVDARFIGCADGFTVHGPTVGRDAALVGAGLNVQWCSRFSTYFFYDGVLGRNNYDNNSVSGGLRFGF